MPWTTVVTRIKIYGPDGTPMTVNGIPITNYNAQNAAAGERIIRPAAWCVALPAMTEASS